MSEKKTGPMLALGASLVACSFALLATAAAAQSVEGIHFGETLDSVRTRYSGNYAPIDGSAGSSFINRPDGYIWFCNERVTSMQERIGSDLHVFMDSVVELTEQYGEPEWLARNVQTRSGEISTLEAKWRLAGYSLAIGYLFNAEKLDVTRTYSTPDTCTGSR